MFNKLLSVRTLTPSFLRHVSPKPKPAPSPVPDPPDECASAVKIIHAGGVVEHYYMAIPAVRIMEKYPSFLLARPEIFRRPWDSLVRPEEILTPGQKFFIVPRRTVKKLRRRIRKPIGELSVDFSVTRSSSGFSGGSVSRKEKDETSTRRSKSNVSGPSGEETPGGNESGETSATHRRVTFSRMEPREKSTSSPSENKGEGVGNSTRSASTQGHRRKMKARKTVIWHPTLAVISEGSPARG